MGTRICAGFPSPADDFLDGELDLTRILAPNRPATFLWRVSGSSMVDVGIHDGDVVVVDRSVTPRDGFVVVAVIDDQTSLKLYRAGPPPMLTFANKTMPVFPLEEAAVAESGVSSPGRCISRAHEPGVRADRRQQLLLQL